MHFDSYPVFIWLYDFIAWSLVIYMAFDIDYRCNSVNQEKREGLVSRLKGIFKEKKLVVSLPNKINRILLFIFSLLVYMRLDL